MRGAILSVAALLAAAASCLLLVSMPPPGSSRPRVLGPERLEEDPSGPPWARGRMEGLDESWNERWLDAAGRPYSAGFRRSFSYTSPAGRRPEVTVLWRRSGPRLEGRLEARGLKPNFTYQMKLRGDWARDPRGAEAIGLLGRWRLPGLGTNYTDEEYRSYPDTSRVEAYILFDHFTTDGLGRAVKDFRLSASLHVLYLAGVQSDPGPWDSAISHHVLIPEDPAAYLDPDAGVAHVRIWAQSEKAPGRPGIGRLKLPAGDYKATLVLTEESFHDACPGGGFWATVMGLPLEFHVE